jgi:hypothetical protein
MGTQFEGKVLEWFNEISDDRPDQIRPEMDSLVTADRIYLNDGLILKKRTEIVAFSIKARRIEGY